MRFIVQMFLKDWVLQITQFPVLYLFPSFTFTANLFINFRSFILCCSHCTVSKVYQFTVLKKKLIIFHHIVWQMKLKCWHSCDAKHFKTLKIETVLSVNINLDCCVSQDVQQACVTPSTQCSSRPPCASRFSQQSIF